MPLIFGLVGLLMLVAGVAAIAFGAPMIRIEQGWSMVIAGSVGSSAGVLCLALAAMLRESKALRRAFEGLSDKWPAEGVTARSALQSAAGALDVSAGPRRTDVERAGDTAAARPGADVFATEFLRREPASAEVLPFGPRREPENSTQAYDGAGLRETVPENELDTVSAAEPGSAAEAQKPVRTFTIGATTFVVFVDGSIEARAPDGTRRFQGMQEARDFFQTKRG